MQNEGTSVRDWYIIKILDDDNKDSLVGQLLWGYIVVDLSGRFNAADYVCTSMIEQINGNAITTAKGSEYIVIGAGKEFEAYFSEVDILRKGYSPTQVARLRAI